MRALARRHGVPSLFAVALALSLANAAFADERREQLQAAQRAFELGVQNESRPLQARRHFAEAADHYRALHGLGVRDPALYLNLGNAAALADRWSESLWAYHVGLKLAPNDTRLRAHREQIRAKVALPAYGQGRNEAEHWPVWLYRPSFEQYVLAAGIFYTAGWLLGALAWRRRSRVLMILAFIALALLAIAGLTAWHEDRQAQLDRDTPLIIVADNTPLYRGNGPNYPAHPDIAMLPRGLEARQIHQRGAWLQIRLTSSEVGWIPRARALVVAP